MSSTIETSNDNPHIITDKQIIIESLTSDKTDTTELEIDLYDPSLFLLNENGLNELTCSICLQLLHNPVLTNNMDNGNDEPCAHSFCSNCINSWLNTVSTSNSNNTIIRSPYNRCCCYCRKLLFPSQLIPDIVKRRKLYNAKVKCIYHVNGCNWIGDWGKLGSNLENHINQCSSSK